MRTTKTKKLRLLFLSILLSQAFATSMSFADVPNVMKCSHQLPPEHHISKVIDQWAAEIEALSGEEIDVQVFGGSSLETPEKNASAVATGGFQCGFTLNRQWGNKLPLMDVTLAPFTFDHLDKLKKWNRSETAAVLERKLLSKGLKNVIWLFSSWQTVLTSDGKALSKPSDFEGAKIQGINPIADASLRALGAIPIDVPNGKMFEALKEKEIDIGLASFSSTITNKYFSLRDQATVLPLYSQIFHGYVNAGWYADLSEKSKNAIVEAGNSAALWAIDASEISAAAAPQILKENGMKVHAATDSEIANLKIKMKPAFATSFEDATGVEGVSLLKLIKDL
ncbi:TRAP transporter substrate-binding protein DctP [Sneathiella marina]|uniref:TRAP transporter substrate-binding protein DctP n=1 Tax=Sneathiella marina TaxID=2950108 RepID=A0ABY4W434_9PROT|nr:TRAP transporter substrate-binding protein DctP [Sneathiella marina]USG60878.1 TRAP transporter substrate-binding protein DctP [Sneathiella marina]